MKKILLTSCFIIGITMLTIAQDKGYTGGFQFKAMLGSNYFNGGANITELDAITIEHSQKFGYVFGMTFRKKFTKALSAESGLRLVQRNYAVKIDSVNTSYQSNIDYRIIGYEIPLKGLVTLRASKNSYFLVGLGVELDLYPSDVFASSYDWQVQTDRNGWGWIQGSFLANAGWEVHPPGNGTFYAGLSFNRPFTAPFIAKVGESTSTVADISLELNGVYLALDLRYYFETKKNKKVEK